MLANKKLANIAVNVGNPKANRRIATAVGHAIKRALPSHL